MKLKLGLVFILVAAAIILEVFKKDFMSYSSTDAAPKVASENLTKEIIYNHLFSSELFDYKGNKLTIDQPGLNMTDRIYIHLWASWCAPCVNEVPELIEFAEQELSKSSIHSTFIIVSLDENQDDLQKFLKSFPKFDQNIFVRVWDKNSSISKLLNADRLPMTVMISKNQTTPRIIRGVVDWKNLTY